MHSVLQDVRYGIRLLLKNPGFTAVAVFVLALGIGANTAVFSIVNAVVFQPVPGDAEAVVGIYNRNTTRPDDYRSFSYAEFQLLKSSPEVFTDVMAHTVTMAGVTEGDSTRRSFAAIVSREYFTTLRTTLAAGRLFTEEEDRPGSDVAVVIAGHQFARKSGMTPAEALGRTIRINARDYTVIGIAPEGFAGTMALVAPELWLPLGVYPRLATDFVASDEKRDLRDATHRPLMLVGRLKPGLSPAAADPLLRTISARLQQERAPGEAAHALMVQKLPRLSVSTDPQTDTGASTLSAMLMGMAAMVLLIACLNLANMLLARGSARRKEIALRLAIGSGRARIVRQLLTESLIIAVLGSAGGLLLAVWGTSLLTATLTAVLPMVLTFNSAPDLNVLAATMGFAVLATLIAGVGPAWKATRPDLMGDLKEQAGQPDGPRRMTMRNLLVVGQVALSLALLTAAGLFMRGAVKASVADPGFALDGVLVNVSPQLAGYDEVRGEAAVRAVLARVRGIPGIESASLASIVPFGDMREGRTVQKAGTPPAEIGQTPDGVNATYTVIGSDYFATLRVPVLRGRGFTRAEEESARGGRVAIIDQPLATRLFGSEDPVGQRIQFAPRDGARAEPLEVIGVATGVRDDMFDKAPEPHVYLPYGQASRGTMFIHARLATTGDAAEAAMLGTLRQEIRAVDPNVPILSMKSLRQHRDAGLGLWAVTSGARVFSVFGAVALVLAVVGVYGLKSYVVSRRTREIGVRMALGATPGDVLSMVMREGLALTAAGVGLGAVLSWGVARLLSGMLYQVSALDPVVFAVAPALLTAAALGASYLPARRATAVQPLAALRSE